MKIRPVYLFLIFLVILTAFMRTCSRISSSAEKGSYLMGTPVRVKVEGPNASYLADLAIDEMKRLDKLFSRFDPNSEISALNREGKIQLSPDTLKILEQSERLKKLTRGAFDIALGRPHGKIDLGAIAKGYAGESARALLVKSGAKSGIIDLRSSIAVFGPKTWKVGIQHPREKDRLIGTVGLKNGQSLATSGDYERGKHIIDPRTGKPAGLCQSVTVIGGEGAQTDALATAIFVLGPVAGMRLANEQNVRAIIVDKNGVIYDNSRP